MSLDLGTCRKMNKTCVFALQFCFILLFQNNPITERMKHNNDESSSSCNDTVQLYFLHLMVSPILNLNRQFNPYFSRPFHISHDFFFENFGHFWMKFIRFSVYTFFEVKAMLHSLCSVKTKYRLDRLRKLLIIISRLKTKIL